MSSVGLFIGVMLIILSLHASHFSELLKMLGFKKESADLFLFSMFFSLIGFLLFMVAYPNPPMAYPLRASLL